MPNKTGDLWKLNGDTNYHYLVLHETDYSHRFYFAGQSIYHLLELETGDNNITATWSNEEKTFINIKKNFTSRGWKGMFVQVA